VRNATGQITTNKPVSLRLNITDAANGGNILYRESHAATTNQFGLVNVAVGNGTLLNGNFAIIAWAGGSRYLQVEVDPAGGNTFTDLGTAQLLSVPYALYAETSGSGGGTPGATGATGDTGAKGDTGVQGATGVTGAGTAGVTGEQQGKLATAILHLPPLHFPFLMAQIPSPLAQGYLML